GGRARDIEKRLRKLRLVQDQIRGLRHLREEEEAANRLSTDLGLPDISLCAPEETAVCDAYLQQREQELRAVDRMLGRLNRWVENAAMARSGWIGGMARLSGMRK